MIKLAKYYKSNYKNVVKSLDNASNLTLQAVGGSARGFVQAVTPVGQYPNDSTRVGGSLKASIDFKVVDKKSVYIGSTLMSEDYPIYVHKGTSKMAAQPYIHDGVMGNLIQLKKIAERNFKL